MIKDTLKKLIAGQDLTSDEMRSSMQEIMDGEATPSQIGAFLALLRVKNETIDEITQAAKVMREKAASINVSGPVIDTCSTGGTGLNHFNISTTSAFVLAGSGVKVAKHGNRAASGKCGSADVLEKLGVNLTITPECVQDSLEKIGIGFMFAPVFHKAMKHAIGPRREMGVRTVFNVLGPLTNPASATHQVLGVFKAEYTDILANVLLNLGVQGAMVVHGAGGMDEISLAGPTRISEVKDGEVNTYEVTPVDFGLCSNTIDDIKGGEVDENAQITRSVLSGDKGKHRDIVLANASAAFVVMGMVSDFREGAVMAVESIDSGRALNKLNELVEFTNNCGE
jgi:anthranilate phosphoribosyltransferase